MIHFLRSLKGKPSALLIVILALLLTACAGIPIGSSSNNSNPSSSITITVGGKADNEGRLLTKLYVLMLRHAGFNAVEHAAPGTDGVVFKAITSGQIDLYPEFTGTGLTKLGLNSTGNAQQDYLQIRQGYEAKYQITWLEPSPLNDTYGVCSTQTRASNLGATKISDLTTKTSKLTIATSADGVHDGINVMKAFYGFTFKKVVTYNQENLTFPAVNTGNQDLNICHTTSADIARYKFILLQDDKNAFPVNNPAPVVRDSMLKKAPEIATVLNKLAPYLTTQISQQLQSEVVNDRKGVTEVATQFLQSKGLL